MVKYLKWILFSCLAIGLLTLFSFKEQIILKLVTQSINYYSYTTWGEPLTYDDLFIKDHQLVIKNPQLKTQLFKAKELKIQLISHFPTLHLDIFFVFDHPSWHLQPVTPKTWEKLEKKIKKKLTNSKVAAHFIIHQGSVSWFSFNQQLQQLIFDLEANNQTGGQLQLYSHDQKKLTLRVTQNLDAMTIEGNCHELDASLISHVYDLFQKDRIRWIIQSGKINGEFKVILPIGTQAMVAGLLQGKFLTMTHLDTHLNAQLPTIELALNQETLPDYEHRILVKNASLDQMEWKLENLNGELKFNDFRDVLVYVSGKANQEKKLPDWKIDGKMGWQSEEHFVDLVFLADSYHETLHYSMQQMVDIQASQLTLKNFCLSHYTIFQPLLIYYWKEFENVTFDRGHIDAEMTFQSNQLNITHLHCVQPSGDFIPWQLHFECDQVNGTGCFDHDFRQFHADMHVDEGEMYFEPFPGLPLTTIYAHFRAEQGKIQQSLLTFQWAGLKGVSEISWETANSPFLFKLTGPFQKITPYLPSELSQKASSTFRDDEIILMTQVKKGNNSLLLEGVCQILSPNLESPQSIHFGGELKKQKQENLTHLIPTGWFFSQQFPLEKFVAPFILSHQNFHLEGKGEVKGKVDQKWLILNYEIPLIKIENDHFLIQSQQAHALVPGQLAGYHQIHLQDYTHSGQLPIQQVSYLEKNHQLFFEDIQGVVHFNDHSIHIDHLEAMVEGIHLAGELLLNGFDLSLQFPRFSGSLSQIQHFLKHFSQSVFLELPFSDGEITQRQQGLHLNFHFTPSDYTLQASIQGMVTDGMLPFIHSETALKGIDLDFSYQHEQQLLSLTDIQGTLLIGKGEEAQPYQLMNSSIIFKEQNMWMDLNLKEEEEELARLVAYTTQDDHGEKYIHLDSSLTHLGSIYPSAWKCCLTSQQQLKKLNWQTTFLVEDVLNDLQRFTKTKKGMVQRYFHLLSDVKGLITLDFNYQPDAQHYSFHLNSEQIQQGNRTHQVSLQGNKKEKKWIIDHLKWNDFQIYGEFLEEKDHWKIPFLGIEEGSSLLMGLEGEWFPQDEVLKGKIKFCKCDLSQLSNWQPWQLQGILQMTGDFAYHFKNEALYFHLPDGRYSCKNKFYDFSRCYLQIQDRQLKFHTCYQLDNHPVQWSGQNDWPFFQKGDYVLDDQTSSFPLIIQWQMNQNQKWMVTSMQGSFAGCHMHLIQDVTSDQQLLQGKVKVETKTCLEWLPKDLKQQWMSLNLPASFELTGKFNYDSDQRKALLDQLTFQGLLSSEAMVIKGYQLGALNTQCHYWPNHVEMQALTVVNEAGCVQVPQLKMHFNSQQTDWLIEMPVLVIKQLRPHLLKTADTHPRLLAALPPLIIKKLELKNFSGNLNLPETWQGSGSLHFIHATHQNFPHALCGFSSETLLHLGLSPQVLNPVTGTIFFQMQRETIYLTRFKDVFSEGRRSKFYLADVATPSWINFKGQLAIHLRLKQYNFMFKMAEPFMVSIEGDLQHLHYRLQKQVKRSRKKKSVIGALFQKEL